MNEALLQHLQTGCTTVCRLWHVRRKDGKEFGFTDHDCDLALNGTNFIARSGLTASAIENTNGMAVDNTEVLGALSDASISETDILAGRYDGADVTIYLVNWRDKKQHSIIFKGSIGEITQGNGKFSAELRSLTDALNVRTGRVYQSECSADLGDHQCKVNLYSQEYSIESQIKEISEGRIFELTDEITQPERWFQNGRLKLKSGEGYGQSARIKFDRNVGGKRLIEIWSRFGVPPNENDDVVLLAGCNKTSTACKIKFNNFLNFRGFPHIPGDDWLRSSPNSLKWR